jgi:hypothetical protein
VPRSWSGRTRHDRGDHGDQQDQKQATARPRSHREEARRAMSDRGQVRVAVAPRVDGQPRRRGSRHQDLALGAPPARAASERVRRQDELRRRNRERAAGARSAAGGRRRPRPWSCWTSSSAAAYGSSSPCLTTPAAPSRYGGVTAVRRHESMGIEPSRLVSATSRASRPSPAEATSMASLAFTRSRDHPARSSRSRSSRPRPCLRRRSRRDWRW